MRQAILALSLLFSTSCQAQTAPDLVPPAGAGSSATPSAPTQTPELPFDLSSLTANAGSCFAAGAKTLPENTTARAREVSAMLHALPASQNYSLAHLTVCDGLPASIDYMLNATSASDPLYIVDADSGSAGQDVVNILAAQTKHYLQIPVAISYEASAYMQVVRLHMGHRLWQIVQAAEDLAAKGQTAPLAYLEAPTTAASDDILTSQLGTFTKLYRESRAKGAAPTDAFVATLKELQKPESTFFDAYDMATSLTYLNAIIIRNGIGSTEPLGFLPIPAEQVAKLHPELSVKQIEELQALPVTSATPDVQRAMDFLKLPEVIAPQPTPEQLKQSGARLLIA